MEYLDLLYNDLTAKGIVHPYWVVGLIGAALVFFFIQLHYYLGRYGRLPRFRNNRGIRQDIPSPPVSVVVVVRGNSFYFIEHTLPLLLGQQYDEFEVVLVDCSYDDEIGEILREKSLVVPNLHVTCIRQQSHHEHSIKLALTVGIKAARYEHLIFTTQDSYPVSEKWLSLMAKGFIGGNVVIGYCGIEIRKGFANRMIRCNRLATSVRYLAAAIRGRAYRGISHNIGYTKSLYFAHKGFNHLNMNIGDDDLFIQTIATPTNVSIIMNPHATVRQMQYGGLGWWHAMRKTLTYAFRYYPRGIRTSISFELWSRMLFFLTAIAAIILLPPWWKIIPALFLLLRLLIVELKIWRIGKRLGERKLAGTYILYDLTSPLGECFLALSRRLRPNRAVWR